jgi:sterol desaturase/sphingolipid hydroxylase (fatty acid hydroxylase superfamily)
MRRALAYGLASSQLELLGLLLMEHWRPLRQARFPKMRRLGVNAAMATSAAGTVLALYPVIVLPMLAGRHGGTFGAGRTPRRWARALAAFLSLDAMLWLWHVANHRLPFLWRFHAAHHLDGDLDVSTALRFHPGELALSTLVRAVQVRLLRIDARTLLAWELAVLLSIQFHHSNLRLPPKLERALGLVIATPRLHGLHHSVDGAERNSNFANLLTLWDRLFGTFHWSESSPVEIGLPRFSRQEAQSFGTAVTLPFASSSSRGRANESDVGPGTADG